MKTHIILSTLFFLYISTSLALLTVKHPAPFILDTEFLDVERNPTIPAFSQLPTLLQQNYRDDSKIKEFLQKLRDRLADEKASHKEIIDKQRAQCDEEDKYRNQAVEDGQEAAKLSEKQLNLCKAEKDKANGLKDLADNALIIYKRELGTLEANRANQRRQFQDKKQRLEGVQDALDEALKFVDEAEVQAAGIKAPEFVQLTNRLLTSSLRSGHSHLVVPMYSKMLQMHSMKEFNADDIKELRNLLNTLKGNAITAVEDLEKQDQADEDKYKASHDALNELIEKLDTQSGDASNQITNMETCIARETSVNTMALDKVKRNTELLEKSEDLCKKSEGEYEEAERARNKQQVILNALDAALSKVIKEQEQPDVRDIIEVK